MEWPCGWATLYLLISVSNIFCQNVPLERMLPEVSAQPQTTNSKSEVILTQTPSKEQIINALLSYANAKTLLPKTTQMIQSTPPQKKSQIATSQNTPTLTFVPLKSQMSSNCDKQPKLQTESVTWSLPPQTCQGLLQPQLSSNCEKQPIISSIPAVSVNSVQNQVSPLATSCSQGLMVQPKLQTESVSWSLPPQTCQGLLQPQVSSNCEKQPIISSIPAVSVNSIQNHIAPPATSCSQRLMVQPRLQTESVSWTLPPQTCQGGCLENCACAQPSQTVWQIPQPPQLVTTVNSCPSNQPFVFNKAIPSFANWQISPSPCIFTPINTECSTVENVYETNCGALTEEPFLVTCDSKPGIPINLQINIPSPNDQCPTITIITNAPTNPEPVPAFSPYAFSPPTIMMRKSRSCLSKLLPIILLGLIEDCGSCRGCGCPYNCNSDDIISIPYPIPISVNNPMMNLCNSPCSSRN